MCSNHVSFVKFRESVMSKVKLKIVIGERTIIFN